METSDLPELQPESLRAMSRLMVFYAVAGIVVGVAGYLAVGWVMDTIPDNTGQLPTVAPMITMFVVAMLAPVIAVLAGALEGPRTAENRVLGEVAVGSWIGSVIYASISLVIISFTLQGDIGPTYLEFVSLAGLVSVTSIISGTASSYRRRPSGDAETADRSTSDSGTVAAPPPSESTTEPESTEPDREESESDEPESDEESPFSFD